LVDWNAPEIGDSPLCLFRNRIYLSFFNYIPTQGSKIKKLDDSTTMPSPQCITKPLRQRDTTAAMMATARWTKTSTMIATAQWTMTYGMTGNNVGDDSNGATGDDNDNNNDNNEDVDGDGGMGDDNNDVNGNSRTNNNKDNDGSGATGGNNGNDGNGAVGPVWDSGGGGWTTATAVTIQMKGRGGRHCHPQRPWVGKAAAAAIKLTHSPAGGGMTVGLL
jgi:hypothetical protein